MNWMLVIVSAVCILLHLSITSSFLNVINHSTRSPSSSSFLYLCFYDSFLHTILSQYYALIKMLYFLLSFPSGSFLFYFYQYFFIFHFISTCYLKHFFHNHNLKRHKLLSSLFLIVMIHFHLTSHSKQNI